MNETSVLFACSGPGAPAAIAENIAIGYCCAAIACVLLLVIVYDAWRTRRMGSALPIAAILFLMHPAWTVSAIHGDCGTMKRRMSYVFTAANLGLFFWQVAASYRRRADPASDLSPESKPANLEISDVPRSRQADDENPYRAPRTAGLDACPD